MKYFLHIIFLSVLIFGFSSCGNNNDDPTPPTPTTYVAEDLIGTWEIYHSKKDLTTSAGVYYEGFRDPEMDGFLTKFYQDGNTFRFINYNPVNEVIDRGTYDIVNGFIVFTVEETNIESKKADVPYVTKQNLTNFQKEEGFMYVDYTFDHVAGGKQYVISDIRRLRNIAIAPGAHPGVTKLDVNFDDYVGTWEVYNYDIFISGQSSPSQNEKWLDKPNKMYFKFYYLNGQKVGARVICNEKGEETEVLGPVAIVIIDDVIHLVWEWDLGDGTLERDGIFLWITKRTNYTDPETSKQTISIEDKNEYRDQDSPMDLYEINRFLKKI